MKRILNLFILFVIISSPGCKFGNEKNSTESKDTLDVKDFEFKRGKTLERQDWNCDVVKNDIICYPSTWKPVKQNTAYFFAYLDAIDKNTFFTIVNYEKVSDKINALEYLRAGYGQLLADTTEKFTGYTANELIFNNKKTYFGEFYTSLDGRDYLSYSMVFEREGFLYDVVLKVQKNKSSNYKKIFSDILFNLRINGILLFDENDKLDKIRIVDLSKI